MDTIIINQAKFAKNVIALAILVLKGQIQTVSPVRLLFYSAIHVLLLVQLDIIHQAKFAINVIARAVLVLEEQILTVLPVLLLSSFSLNIDVW